MKRYGLIASALAVVLVINLYFRLYPVYFPQLKDQARGMVVASVKQSAAQDVAQRFPQYDPLAKERLIKTRVDDYLKHNKKVVKDQVKDVYRKLKDRFQDSNGQTYMMELDCWHWSRYVKNVVNLGHPGDEVRNGKQYDSRMLSPSGERVFWNQFNFYLPAFLYKIVSIFKTVDLFYFLFYLPLVYTVVFIVFLFMFVRRLSGLIAAVTASLVIGLSPMFVPRSCAGWFDMDVLNMIFPLAIVWTYVNAVVALERKRAFAWNAACAFLVGLFCYAWVNWWFILSILLMYEAWTAGVTAFLRVNGKSYDARLMRDRLLFVAAFVGMSLFWVAVFSRFEAIQVLYEQIKGSITLNKPLLPSIWPNVFSTVGELRRVNMQELAMSLGGTPVVLAMIGSVIALFVRAVFMRGTQMFRRETFLIMMFWFLSMTYASFRGVRFTVFLLIPMGIAIGCVINDLYSFLAKKGWKWQGLLFALAAVVFVGGVALQKGNQIARNIYPLMNDPWYKVLITMRDTTPPDTTINSWWDFGDWFKVVAQRKVIFDGQSQDKPQAYWMAKALLSNNEAESLGILRMLNNGGNKAFETIDEYLKDPLQSVLLLESVIPRTQTEAREMLADFLPDSAVDKVMLLLFDKPGNAVFVVDYSMVFKIPAISYLGEWNFAKVYMVQNYTKMEKDRILDHLAKLGKNSPLMQKFYQELFIIPPKQLDNWISRPLQFYDMPVRGVRKDDTVVFDNGFTFNLKTKSFVGGQGQTPISVFVRQENDLVEIPSQNPTVPVSVFIIDNNNNYAAIALDRALAKSLFVRLYFMNGFGLQHFKNFIDAADGNNYIGVYKIEW